MAEKSPELGDYDRGRLASRTLKKNFLRLSKALVAGDMPLTIYEEDFISEELLDIILSAPKSSSLGGGARLVREIQEKVQAEPDRFDALCQILRKNRFGDLAQSLNGEGIIKLCAPLRSNINSKLFKLYIRRLIKRCATRRVI